MTLFDVPVVPVVIALALYLAALRALRRFAFARDFRVACVSFAIVGVAGAIILPHYAWHLLWYAPLTLVAAFVYSLRGLFALSRRLEHLGDSGVSNPEQLRREIQDAVNEYNDGRDEDQRLK